MGKVLYADLNAVFPSLPSFIRRFRAKVQYGLSPFHQHLGFFFREVLEVCFIVRRSVFLSLGLFGTDRSI